MPFLLHHHATVICDHTDGCKFHKCRENLHFCGKSSNRWHWGTCAWPTPWADCVEPCWSGHLWESLVALDGSAESRVPGSLLAARRNVISEHRTQSYVWHSTAIEQNWLSEANKMYANGYNLVTLNWFLWPTSRDYWKTIISTSHMARCVPFAVARNRRNFAYFSLWHRKYGR